MITSLTPFCLAASMISGRRAACVETTTGASSWRKSCQLLGASLWIDVNDGTLMPGTRRSDGEVDRQGRLAGAPFLGNDRDGFHGLHSFMMDCQHDYMLTCQHADKHAPACYRAFFFRLDLGSSGRCREVDALGLLDVGDLVPLDQAVDGGYGKPQEDCGF